MRISVCSILAISLCLLANPAPAGGPMGEVGRFAKWSRIEISFAGPVSDAAGDPNPFLIGATARFKGPAGQLFDVPVYFDGDGRGGLRGNVWKVRFSTGETGPWRFSTRSDKRSLDGYSGTFEVVDPHSDAPGVYRYGRLRFVGKPYLQFAEGPFWLKGGADSPENFLGTAFGDWDRKRAEIDYLAEQEVNCVYIMTNNIRGDGRDVWPWLGDTEKAARANHQRFDVARLQRWQDFFEHIQARGIVIQIVLNDDSAWLGYDHGLYLRELVARFGYLPAIYWNIGEEYSEAFDGFEAAVRYAEMLAGLDPYDHPIALHNENEPSRRLLENPLINVTSLQTKPNTPEEINGLAVAWHRLSAELEQPVVVSFDEGRPPMERGSVWAAYMGGAMWEAIENTLEKDPAASFRQYETFWREMCFARKFIESMPYWTMAPDNDRAENAFCLAAPGLLYALYAPKADEVGLDLAGVDGDFEVVWYRPDTGEYVVGAVRRVSGGGRRSLGRAPFEGDAAVVVRGAP